LVNCIYNAKNVRNKKSLWNFRGFKLSSGDWTRTSDLRVMSSSYGKFPTVLLGSAAIKL